MTTTPPCPVIVCDVCGLATPARFLPRQASRRVTVEERMDELRGQGWTLTPTRDTCPTCSTL